MEKFFRYKNSKMVAKIDNNLQLQELLRDSSWHEISNQEYELFIPKVENNEDSVATKIKIKNRLAALSEDMVQYQFGAIIDDIEEKKKEFVKLHNQIRLLEGKPDRIYRYN